MSQSYGSLRLVGFEIDSGAEAAEVLGGLEAMRRAVLGFGESGDHFPFVQRQGNDARMSDERTRRNRGVGRLGVESDGPRRAGQDRSIEDVADGHFRVWAGDDRVRGRVLTGRADFVAVNDRRAVNREMPRPLVGRGQGEEVSSPRPYSSSNTLKGVAAGSSGPLGADPGLAKSRARAAGGFHFQRARTRPVASTRSARRSEKSGTHEKMIDLPTVKPPSQAVNGV